MRHRLWLSLVPVAGLAGPRSRAAAADGDFKMPGPSAMACHTATGLAAGVAPDTLTPEGIPADAQTRQRVVSRRGPMPPPGEPRPIAPEFKACIAWAGGALDKPLLHTHPGSGSSRRLNRNEFTDAVQFPLGLNPDPASLLRADVAAGPGREPTASSRTCRALTRGARGTEQAQAR